MSSLNISYEVVASSHPSLVGMYVYESPHLFKSQGAFHLLHDSDGFWTFIIHNRPYYASTTRSINPVGLDWYSFPGKSPISIVIEKIYTAVKSPSRNTLAAMYGHHAKEAPSPSTALLSESERNAKSEQNRLVSHFDTWYGSQQGLSSSQSVSSPSKAAISTPVRLSYASIDAGVSSPSASWQSTTFVGSRPTPRSGTPTQLSRPTGECASPSVPRAPLPGARPIASVITTASAAATPSAHPAIHLDSKEAEARAAFVAYLNENCQHAGSPRRRSDVAPPPSPTTVSTGLLAIKPVAGRSFDGTSSLGHSFSFSTAPESEEPPHIFTTLWREQTAARDAKDAREVSEARELWERKAQLEAAAEKKKHHQDLCDIYVSRGVHHHVYNPIPESTQTVLDVAHSRNVEAYKAAAAKAGEDARKAGAKLQTMQSKARSAHSAHLNSHSSAADHTEDYPPSATHTATHTASSATAADFSPEEEKLGIQTIQASSRVNIGRATPTPSSPPVGLREYASVRELVREVDRESVHTPSKLSLAPQDQIKARTTITSFPSSPVLNLVPLSSIKKDKQMSVSSPGPAAPHSPSKFPAFLPFSNPSTPISHVTADTSKPQRPRSGSATRPIEVRRTAEVVVTPTSVAKSRLGHAGAARTTLSPSEATHVELKELREGIARLESSVVGGKSPAASPVQSRADALVERWNELRDASPSQPPKSPVKQAGEYFPTCEEMARLFRKDFHDDRAFEQFAFDAREVIDQVWPGEDSLNILVHHVLAPLHEATLNYVTRKIRASQNELAKAMDIVTPADNGSAESVTFRQVWLLARQQRMYTEVVAMSDRDTSLIFCDIEAVTYVHSALQGGVRIRQIDGAHMTIPSLVRRLLRAHALAALSEPRCTLHPAPGTAVQFRSDSCKGMLGRAENGDIVEVVLSGLYFDDVRGGSKCVVPSIVRPL